MLVFNGSRTVSSSRVFPRSGAVSLLRRWWSETRLRNLSIGEGITDEKVAVPDGNRHPAAWLLATRDGALAARNTLDGSSSYGASVTGGRNAETTIAGVGGVSSADLGLIVSAVAAISASGALSSSITGKLEAAASLAGQGQITAALGALASVVMSLTGAGAVSGTATARASMSSDLNVTGGALTTANVAQFVWSALASAYNSAGTMGGELLRDADIEKIADVILRRATSNVEASSSGDPLDLRSLYGMIAQAVHNTQVSGTTLTVTESDDTTVLGTRTVTLDPTAQPITGIDSV